MQLLRHSDMQVCCRPAFPAPNQSSETGILDIEIYDEDDDWLHSGPVVHGDTGGTIDFADDVRDAPHRRRCGWSVEETAD